MDSLISIESSAMTENINPNTRIAKNTLFLSIRMVIVLGINLYATRAILNMMGIEDYGIYNLVCGFVSMFTFLSTSMSNAIQRFYNYELGKNGLTGARNVYNTSLLVQILFALLIVLFTEIIGLWYLNHKMIIPDNRIFAAQSLFHFSIASFFFIIIKSPFLASVMAHEKMDFYAIVSVLDAIIKLLIILIIPYLYGDRLILYGALLTFISFTDFIIYYIYAKRHFSEITFNWHFDKELFKQMLSFSGWNIFGTFSGVMKEQGINLVINLFYGPVVNAARGVAAQVNSGLQSFISTLSTPVRPQVIQSYATGNVSRTMTLTYSISKLTCLFLYLITLPIIYEIDYILHLWLGDNVPEYASIFVIIIILTSFINNLNSAISGVVHASGKMKVYQLTTSIMALSSIPLSYYSLKLGLPPETALWIVLITMLLVQIVALLVLKNIIKYSIKEYLSRVIIPILKVIICTIWIPYFIIRLSSPNFTRLIIVFLTSTTLTSVIIYFLGLNNDERKLLLKVFKIKTNKD